MGSDQVGMRSLKRFPDFSPGDWKHPQRSAEREALARLAAVLEASGRFYRACGASTQQRRDHGVAEAIGQGIGEETWQATKGAARQFRKAVDPLGQRHHQRSQLNTAGQERRLEFKGGDTVGLAEGHRTDARAPEFHGRHGPGCPQLQVLAGLVVRGRLARLRVARCCSKRASGEGWGSGSSSSSRSRRSSWRNTRRNKESWVAAAPASSRSRVRLEMPACSAN